jgi:hypothetical protein
MNRILACVLLSIGTVLVVYGFNALNSVTASFSRLVRGAPPEQALWFLLAGVLAMVLGITGLFRAPKIRPAMSRRDRSGAPQARRRTSDL